MKLPKIETLLLQEMEEVKGGAGGVCICYTGAGHSSTPDEDASCECYKAAGQIAEDKKEETEDPGPNP